MMRFYTGGTHPPGRWVRRANNPVDESQLRGLRMTDYTSSSTRRLAREAEDLLALSDDAATLERTIEELGDSVEHLTDEERAQVEELGRLVNAGGCDPDVLASLRRDGEFHTQLSDDRMFMTLSVTSPIAGGRAVTAEQVIECLSHCGVIDGVDLKRIREAVATASSGQTVEDVVVVRGRPPEMGDPPHLAAFARASMESEPQRVDLMDLGTRSRVPRMVLEGDVVVKVVPASPGRPGHDAMGRTIDPPEPEDLHLNVGQNITAADNRYLAAVSGVLVWEGDHLDIRRTLVIGEDVNRQYGEVSFDGDVMIHAAVRSGAKVKATGEIVIDGTVEDAQVESTEANVTLRHGVTGRHRGLIRAAGDITARFVENATIQAGGNVVIEVGAMHSHVTAGGFVQLDRGRGQIVGGSVMSGQFVQAQQIGAPSGVFTEVCAGLSTEGMEALSELAARSHAVSRKHDDVAELAERMRRTVGDPAKLSESELKVYTRLRRVQFGCTVTLRRLGEQRERILEQATESGEGRIEVLRELMPNVLLRLGRAELMNQDFERRCRVMLDKRTGRPKLGPLR